MHIWTYVYMGFVLLNHQRTYAADMKDEEGMMEEKHPNSLASLQD